MPIKPPEEEVLESSLLKDKLYAESMLTKAEAFNKFSKTAKFIEIYESLKSEDKLSAKSLESMLKWSTDFLDATQIALDMVDMVESQRKTLEKLLKKKGGPSKKEIEKVFDQYLKLPQGTHTNSLAHKLTTKISNQQLDSDGRGIITDKNFKLFIEGYDKLVNGANASAVKLFDAAVINCGKNRDALARIPLADYMELRGLKDEKEARKQIKCDMEVLKAVKFEYKGTGKRKSDWLSISLYGGRAGIYKGVIEFMFSRDFYASIPENQFMFIPPKYFSIRDRYNPHSSSFLRRIAEHKRMNLGKTNENNIGVETLINSSTTFPKYVETKGSHFAQLILEPFERDMDAAPNIKWHYAGEQPTNYNDFIKSSVVITWEDYPDVGKLTQHKKLPPKEAKTPKKRVEKEG